MYLVDTSVAALIVYLFTLANPDLQSTQGIIEAVSCALHIILTYTGLWLSTLAKKVPGWYTILSVVFIAIPIAIGIKELCRWCNTQNDGTHTQPTNPLSDIEAQVLQTHYQTLKLKLKTYMQNSPHPQLNAQVQAPAPVMLLQECR
ncbi:hypothetical protein FRX31_003960 [Thalictrum thalictroides]|uniref:Transmembrane protein n=1 Tax=Thalictrum thalictroides TaxID=46969 RepID=A0A7J6XAH7_THATH|nr:hypothetical protein FRX31_003960 [Thalictrum thalictroides]